MEGCGRIEVVHVPWHNGRGTWEMQVRCRGPVDPAGGCAHLLLTPMYLGCGCGAVRDRGARAWPCVHAREWAATYGTGWETRHA